MSQGFDPTQNSTATDASQRPRWAREEGSGNEGRAVTRRPGSAVAPAPADSGVLNPEVQETRNRIHRKLMDRLNLSSLAKRDRDEAETEVARIVHRLMADEMVALNMDEREQVVEQILYEIFGLGPLEPLLQDQSISDILVNTHDQVFVERDGKLEEASIAFRDDRHLLQIIDRIVSAVGRRIDDSSPMVDARLADGSRVNAIIPPLAIDGPHLSIRKFRRDVLSAEQLLEYKSLSPGMLEFMQGCVKARLNILVSGGTGSGKTTFLNMLSESIPVTERIVSIEDSAELQLRQPHVVRLETRPPNIEGSGSVDQRALVINALRMRPDRIILGEVRAGEALDMLQAMNTGHDGSLTTLHANSPRDALGRLETMVQMAATTIGERAMRQQISSAIDIVIQLARLSDGRRKVVSVAEVLGMEGDIVTMQDLFYFERKGMDEDGNVLGAFRPTGIMPKAAERLTTYGVNLQQTVFADSAPRFGGRAR